MNKIPYKCDYVPDLFNMASYNKILHIYYDDLLTKDLKVCMNLIKSILKKRGHLVEDIKINTVKTKSKSVKKKFIKKYFESDYRNTNQDVSEFEKIINSNAWDNIFQNKCTERKYYVYVHSDNTLPNFYVQTSCGSFAFKGTPFYIGKGNGDRINEVSGRAKFHIKKLKEIKLNQSYKHEDCIYKIAENLTEAEALILESKLIHYFGCINEIHRNKIHFTGRKGGLLINQESIKGINL